MHEWPTLVAGEVHVWRSWMDRQAAEIERLRATLSAREQERAERLRQPRDRDRFITGRGALRSLLSGYVGRPAAQLLLRYGTAGKPALAGPEGEWLRFNVSHSGGLLVIAIAGGREIGVDVERIDEGLDWPGLCRFLPEAEQAAISTQPPAGRRRAFFQAWTRQEAWLKALGRSLSEAFEGRLWPPGWSQVALELEPAFAAALVVEGAPPAVRLFDFDSGPGLAGLAPAFG